MKRILTRGLKLSTILVWSDGPFCDPELEWRCSLVGAGSTREEADHDCPAKRRRELVGWTDNQGMYGVYGRSERIEGREMEDDESGEWKRSGFVVESGAEKTMLLMNGESGNLTSVPARFGIVDA